MNQTIANDILFPEIERLLNEGRTVKMTPQGSSMLPFIRGGEDSVTLLKAENPKVGDILLCRLNGNIYVLHRLIRINEDTFTLRGDGNIQGEEMCKREDAIGRVISIERPDGRPKRLTRGSLWQWLYPYRRILLKIYRKSHKILHK